MYVLISETAHKRTYKQFGVSLPRNHLPPLCVHERSFFVFYFKDFEFSLVVVTVGT